MTLPVDQHVIRLNVPEIENAKNMKANYGQSNICNNNENNNKDTSKDNSHDTVGQNRLKYRLKYWATRSYRSLVGQ